MSARRAGAVLAAAAAAAMVASSVAPAADTPQPCAGKLLVTDPTGDAFVGFIGLAETPIPAGANVDVTGIFVNNIDGRVTFNIRVDNLDKTLGNGATANVYRLNYTVGTQTNYLQASVSATGVTYSYGHSDTTGLVRDGDAKGTFYEGKDGVIEIEVPTTHGGKPGAKWSAASLFTAYVRGNVNTQTDEAPDAGGDFSYSGAPCAAAGPTATPTPAGMGHPTGPTGPTGTPSPTDPTNPAATATPTATPAPGGSQPVTGPLRVTVAPLKLKAKKVKRVKKLAFAIRPSESMTDVKLTLKKKAKTLGSATVGDLQGQKVVKVKLRKKGLKKGRYAVVVTAKRPDGSPAAATFSLRVK